MSREIYTYTDLSGLAHSRIFREIKRYPQVAVSADLRKSLKGRLGFDHVEGIFSNDIELTVVDSRKFGAIVDKEWRSGISKLHELVLLSGYVRKRLEKAEEGSEERKWLLGCLRNIKDIHSSILLLEEMMLSPADIMPEGDRNLKFLVEVWENIREKAPVIGGFQERVRAFQNKSAWKRVFNEAFHIADASSVTKIVFHGFYYFTPYQEALLKQLEKAGYDLIFLFPYDERYPFVYEIWEKTYSEENGYPAKSQWHMEKTEAYDSYGEIFAGRNARVTNKLQILEYASVMEFVDEIKKVKQEGYTIYSSENTTANQILKDYFPEEYGERKLLSYPIGQFISTLNEMWDEEQESIVLDEDRLIECFSSGWLAHEGISGKEYIQDLVYILPFFEGCHTLEEWERRLALFEEIQDKVISVFQKEKSPDEAVARWQEIMENPLSDFSPFSVPKEKLDVILVLIRRLLYMAQDLFGKNEVVSIQSHVLKLDNVLKRHEMSNELYEEERELVKEIFEQFSQPGELSMKFQPADISRALSIFMYGKFGDGELQVNSVGMVSPLYFVDAACVKNNGRVHICLCDVNSMPGKNKPYTWPLSGRKMKECLRRTGNSLIKNMIWIMESRALCNRYFMYSALKNKEVQISWISTMGEKILAPSSYIRLICESAGIKITPAKRNRITYEYVSAIQEKEGKILPYQKEKMPLVTSKEARMDYALCPMRYVLGYLVEKHPVYQSGFQQTYALNALISALSDLMQAKGFSIDMVYQQVMVLFPGFRKVEKRQVYDYLKSDYEEEIMEFTGKTECGDRTFTEERLKIHFPDQRVRQEAGQNYSRLMSPEGRTGMNLFEKPEGEVICTFCPHVNYCRNARYTKDQEMYYD